MFLIELDLIYSNTPALHELFCNIKFSTTGAAFRDKTMIDNNSFQIQSCFQYFTLLVWATLPAGCFNQHWCALLLSRHLKYEKQLSPI